MKYVYVLKLVLVEKECDKYFETSYMILSL